MPPLCLADVSAAAPDHVRDALLIGLALVGALGVISSIVFGIISAVRQKQTRVLPDPLRTAEADSPVERREFAAQMNAALERICTLEESVADVRRAQTEQIGRVHSRVDKLVEVVARLEGVVDGVRDALKEVRGELSKIPRGKS